jgi:MEMO1 family protein
MAIQNIKTPKKIRLSQYSGSWYPNSKEKITQAIEEFNIKKEPEKNLKALILPHAGWIYSGKTAYMGISKIPKNYKKFILIGPSHRALFSGASLPNYTHYQTPLGELEINLNSKSKLLENDLFQINDSHKEEHSLEIILPLLQTQLDNFDILPILISSANSYKQISEISNQINKIIDNETFIIISSDFTHYGSSFDYLPFTKDIENKLKELDLGAIKLIQAIEPTSFLDYCKQTQITICGRYPIAILLEYLKNKDYASNLITYTTSGKLTNDFTNSVSYAVIGFYKSEEKKLISDNKIQNQEEYTDFEKNYMLKLARDTLTFFLQTKKLLNIQESKITEKLLKNRACFTTLTINHELRGCVGNLVANNKLYKSIQENIIHAAIHDTRFNPVSIEELKKIKIEISVLTKPKALVYDSTESLLNQLKPHIHGVILENKSRSSTYLPQVWEYFTDKQDFLESLCEKGGMPSDCWKDKSTKIQTYKALIFTE